MKEKPTKQTLGGSGQRIEDRGQGAEDRGQRAEDSKLLESNNLYQYYL